jgi:PST family polysaccharide transporter
MVKAESKLLIWFQYFKTQIKSVAARNIYISLIFKILTSLLFLILVPYAIRSLGAEKYGIAAFFLTMHGYVSLLDSGFTYALGLQYTQKLVHNQSDARDVFYSAVPVYLLLSIIAFLSFAVFRKEISILAFNTEIYSFEMFLFGFVIAFSTLDSMLSTVLQAHEKINLIATGRFLLDLVKVAGVALMGYMQFAPEAIVYFIILSVLVKIIFDLFYFLKLLPEFKIKLDWLKTRAMLKLALPSVGIALCSLFMSMMDKFLVSGKISATAFTSYSFAYDLTTKAYFLVYAVTSVIYPKLIKNHSQGHSRSHLLKIQFLAVLLMALVYYLPLSLFAEPISSFLIGPELSATTGVLIQLCSLSAILYLCFTVLESYLVTTGSVFKTLSVYILGIISFKLFLDYFIEKYQLIGVSLAVSSMFTIMILFGLILALSTRKKIKASL